MVVSLQKPNGEGLCSNCYIHTTFQELTRLTKERVFDASTDVAEGNEALEMSFNKEKKGSIEEDRGVIRSRKPRNRIGKIDFEEEMKVKPPLEVP